VAPDGGYGDWKSGLNAGMLTGPMTRKKRHQIVPSRFFLAGDLSIVVPTNSAQWSRARDEKWIAASVGVMTGVVSAATGRAGDPLECRFMQSIGMRRTHWCRRSWCFLHVANGWRRPLISTSPGLLTAREPAWPGAVAMWSASFTGMFVGQAPCALRGWQPEPFRPAGFLIAIYFLGLYRGRASAVWDSGGFERPNISR